MALTSDTMRLRHVLAVALLGACGPQLRREVVGGGAASVQLRGHAVVAAGAADGAMRPGGIKLARGTYELALRFDVPRAQVIDYAVTCGDIVIPGRIGETFEAYRTRRLAELRAMAERDRRAMAAVTGAVVGAVAPTVHARGQAVGPASTATVDATVSGQAVGDAAGTAVAQSAVPDVIDLAPGDVGAGRLQTRVQLTTAADGACTVNAIAEDPNVIASYEVTHIRNLDAEARERRLAATATAHQVRGSLTAQLTGYGADPQALQRRREAEARARLEAQAAAQRARAEADARRAQAQAEADAKRAQAQAEADAKRAEADRVRAEARAEADAKRARARAEADAARLAAQAELRARLEAEARLKLSIEVRRKRAAMETRGVLIAYLAGECHADPHKRERERAELRAQQHQREIAIKLELEARVAADAKLRAERDARDAKLRAERAERDARDAALRAERDARDAKLRAERDARDAKLRAQREARLQFEADERRVREAKLAAEREARAALALEQRRAREAEQSRRFELALGVRAELQAYLVGLGARQRPAMPALLVETQGPSPFDGAKWIAGYWQWTGGEWAWVAGGWRDTTRFGASGSVGGKIISVGGSVAADIFNPPPYTDPTIRVPQHVDVETPPVRDHRTKSEPTVRDHRTSSEPTVRDHRGNDEPTVRDHRSKDSSNDDDTKPTVRDHRKR